MASKFSVAQAIMDPKLLESATFKGNLTPAERKSKIKREEWIALVTVIKEIALIVFATVCASIIVYLCINIVTNPVSSPDDKKWATSIITLMASGTIGYITGKSSK